MSKETENIRDDEADDFARCLLMPKQLFTQHFYAICEKKIGIHQIAVELGKIFIVETTQAAIRISELKLHNRSTYNKL